MNPHEIARGLIYDFGLKAGEEYARRISMSATDPMYKIEYGEAADIIRAKIDTMRASCEAGSFDLGMV